MILLDTHAWVWWVSEPSMLSARAREAIEDAAARQKLFVSAISVWEVATLVARGRLALKLPLGEWIRACESLPFLQFVPVDNAVALRSALLPEPFHQDPADRMIVATAQILDVPLVTRDGRMHSYPHVRTIW